MSKTYDAAVNFITLGYRVLPLWWLEDGVCACKSTAVGHKAGKHPLTRHGVKDATRNRRFIDLWWKDWPKANVGIATGEGFFAFDIDPSHGGDDSLVKLEAIHGKMDSRIVCLSGGGGRHIYLRTGAQVDGAWVPKDMKVGNKVAAWGYPGLDVRGDGGYVAAPPSSHLSGVNYRWSHPLVVLEDLPLAPLWLMALVTPPQRQQLTPTPSRRGATEEFKIRNASAYLAKIPAADGTGGRGGHTQTLKAASCIYVGFDLSEEEAFRLLWEQYNPKCKPQWTERELRHKLQESLKGGRPRGYLLDAHKDKVPLGYGTPLWAGPKKS